MFTYSQPQFQQMYLLIKHNKDMATNSQLNERLQTQQTKSGIFLDGDYNVRLCGKKNYCYVVLQFNEMAV